MRKKIIIGCLVMAFLLLISGGYTVTSVENTLERLGALIKLHRVEILRENLLLKIRRVQYDLSLKNTRFDPTFDSMVADVRDMIRSAKVCFNCHHEERIEQKLQEITSMMGEYKKRISRILTYSANRKRVQREMDNAYRMGEKLGKDVEKIISKAAARLETQTGDAFRRVKRTKIMLFSLLGVGFLIVTFLSFMLVKSISDPFESLLYGIKRIKKGDLDYRVEGLKDEFGEVAIAFNEMATSLKEQISHIQRAEQLAIFGKFAARLVHEIKNPLAGIKVAVDVLSEEENISGDDKKVLEKVSGEISRIESLLKNLLEFSRPPKPVMASVDVNRIIDLSLELALDGAGGGAYPVKLERDFDSKIPRIYADPKQLEQIFLNIFLNAVEEMERGGILRVKSFFDPEKKCVVVTVSDTGRGILKEDLDRIFHPFYTTKPKGTGLGLAISRQLAEQNGGIVEVESVPGEGTTFTISFSTAMRGEENGADFLA